MSEDGDGVARVHWNKRADTDSRRDKLVNEPNARLMAAQGRVAVLEGILTQLENWLDWELHSVRNSTTKREQYRKGYQAALESAIGVLDELQGRTDADI